MGDYLRREGEGNTGRHLIGEEIADDLGRRRRFRKERSKRHDIIVKQKAQGNDQERKG